jgi:hypothetical protein
MMEEPIDVDRARLDEQLAQLQHIWDDEAASADQRSLAARGIHLIQTVRNLMGGKIVQDLKAEIKALRQQLEQMEKRLSEMEKRKQE